MSYTKTRTERLQRRIDDRARPECGVSVAAAEFCQNCGTEMPGLTPGSRTCPECGSPVSATANYCGNCGSDFVEATSTCVVLTGGGQKHRG